MRDPVTPNRRGARSRESVLDAAERADGRARLRRGDAGRVWSPKPASRRAPSTTTSGPRRNPARRHGARRRAFFTGLPDPTRRLGAAEHLARVVAAVIGDARAPPRLPAAADRLRRAAPAPTAVRSTRRRAVREHALERLRAQIRRFGDPAGAAADQLARFALAAIDGAFVATSRTRQSPCATARAPAGRAHRRARRAELRSHRTSDDQSRRERAS